MGIGVYRMLDMLPNILLVCLICYLLSARMLEDALFPKDLKSGLSRNRINKLL